MGYYETAQICKNGHVITSAYNNHPEFRQAHCQKCGEATVTQCGSCGQPIRGRYEVPEVICIGGSYNAPGYCYACGKPFPWTLMKLEAAKELVAEMDELDEGEREILKKSLDDLVQDSPKTEVASLRFKKVMKKVGGETYDTVKNVVTDLVSETIKKSLFGP